MHTILTIFTALCGLWLYVLAADSNAWRSRNIYFALTDRVARSSNDIGGDQCNNLGQYCGGTFAGLQSKLDYIKGMGFDSIWITPIVASKYNKNVIYSPGGYHGYWAQDLYSVNSNYGTADDLKNLVNSAHEKGMYMMLDVVANHMGPSDISLNRPSPMDEPSSYHPNCDIDYSNQTSIENCRIAGLPDVFSQNSTIRSLYYTWVSSLVTNYSFDGIRIDTVKHIDKDFWTGFSAAAGVYAIGEVFSGDVSYVAGYDQTMPGLLNYPLYYPLNAAYQQKGTFQALADMHDTLSTHFRDPTLLGTFIDNHDSARFLNQRNDISALKNALAYVVLARGIPIVYYGTEQAYSGGNDPSNREDLWRSNFNQTSEIYQTLAVLGAARKAAGGLSGDDHVHLLIGQTVYAWSRAAGQLIVLTTNTGIGSSGTYCLGTQQAPGTQWSATNNIESGQLCFGTQPSGAQCVSAPTYTADTSGNICVPVSNGEPVILLRTGHAPSTTTTACPSPTPTSVRVTFNERVSTAYGETVKIVGSTAQLGSWDPSRALSLSAAGYTIDNPLWSIPLDMPAGQNVSYKFIRVSASSAIAWEADPNRGYIVPGGCGGSQVVDSAWR